MATQNKPEQKKPGQKMRYSDKELGFIKTIFADNEDLLKTLRKVFLQMPIDALDKGTLSAFKGNRDFFAIMRKVFLPTLDSEAPIHQLVDLFYTVDFKEKTPEQAAPLFHSRELLIEYIDQQLIALEAYCENKAPKIKIDFAQLTVIGKKTPSEMFIDMLARNTMIGHTDMQLNSFNILAGRKEETVEETQDRLRKDSSK